jgi:ketosteroid isomerase-like protein
MTRFRIAPFALPVLLAAGLTACAKPEAAKPPVDTAKIADTVKADAAAAVAALNAHDADKATSHDAPGIVGMFHGAPNINSPAEDLAQTKQTLADPAFHLTISDEAVDVASAGDMAIYRAKYAATGTDPKTKKTFTENGNWIVQYKPQPDGSWKMALSVVSDAGSGEAVPKPPAAATPAAPEKK